jgi:hypothetical protein
MIKRKSKHEFIISMGSTSLVPYTPEQLREVRDWCTEVFGPGGRNSKYKWRYGWVNRETDTFYFRNEKDALFFALRWS